MRIGILETDIFAHDIKEKYGSYAEMFQRLLLSVDNRITFNVYQVTEGEYPSNIEECDAYLITGSKASIYDNEAWIIKLKDYIVSLNQQQKKIIGICFGHQLIAQALGGAVKKNDKGWCVGNTSSHIEKEKNWMQPVRKSFSLLVSHQDQVVKLPAQAELIASSELCPYSGFQIADTILTFQGHPEYSEEYLKYLMNKRREILGKTIINKAMDSLKLPQDNQLVAQWIIDFIKTKK